MIGHVFAQRYRLEEFIGKGGMALVFRATDLRTEHDVAVKILRPEYSEDKEFLDRFHREALAASKMSHHNIVNLLDVGMEDGYRYLVMEYVRGRTLKEVIAEKGKLPEPVAAQIAIRILSALQHAHNNGIIHRDIKPQNILVNAEGHVKVADFGIARVAGSNTLSKGDSVMGSVHYFSPEQARGEDVTYASDLYSVGAVMYEMLTGRVPFDGDTPVSIAMQHISAQPKPPSLVVSGISPAMEQVVLTAMSKEPRNRYADAADMARAIRAALNNPGDADTSATPVSGVSARVRVSDSGRVPPAEGRRRKKKKATQTLLLFVMTFAVLAFLAWGVSAIINDITSATEAPYIVGETEESALRLCKEKGLKAEVVRQSDSNVKAGIVIMQSREYQYAMKRGDVIVLTVSTGPEKQAVPKLTGRLVADARTECEKMGFSLLVIDTVLSAEPANTILTQSPEVGEMLAYGEIVQITVSGGSVSVPDFFGMTRDEAMLLASQKRLNVTKIIEYPTADETMIDRVATQYPPTGETLMQNGDITLAVYVREVVAETAAPQQEGGV